MKQTYHGLKTDRTTIETAFQLAVSQIKGGTKNENWQERTINETMGIGDITFTTTSPTQDASRENYWKTDF